MNRQQLRTHIKSTTGFSIVELMISLLLGSALLIMSFHLYFSTKQSELLATTILNTQTEARNAMHHIRQAIEHAGYLTNVTLDSDSNFEANTEFNAGQVIRIKQDNTSASLLVRMQGDKDRPLRSCDGEDIVAIDADLGETWYEFYTEEDQLLCQVYVNGTKTTDAVTIAAPIAALKLRLFSEDDTANTFIRTDSASMTAEEIIKGIQVQLVVRSEETVRPAASVTTIAITGFEDLEFEDKHYYINNNRYFIAQNQ